MAPRTVSCSGSPYVAGQTFKIVLACDGVGHQFRQLLFIGVSIRPVKGCWGSGPGEIADKGRMEADGGRIPARDPARATGCRPDADSLFPVATIDRADGGPRSRPAPR